MTFPGTGTPVHPTQLYDAALDFILFALLLLVARRFVDGWDLMLCSLAGYAVIRFFVEFFRFHANPHGALFFQLMSAAIFVVAVSALLIRRPLAKKPLLEGDTGGEPGPS